MYFLDFFAVLVLQFDPSVQFIILSPDVGFLPLSLRFYRRFMNKKTLVNVRLEFLNISHDLLLERSFACTHTVFHFPMIVFYSLIEIYESSLDGSKLFLNYFEFSHHWGHQFLNRVAGLQKDRFLVYIRLRYLAEAECLLKYANVRLQCFECFYLGFKFTFVLTNTRSMFFLL